MKSFIGKYKFKPKHKLKNNVNKPQTKIIPKKIRKYKIYNRQTKWKKIDKKTI